MCGCTASHVECCGACDTMPCGIHLRLVCTACDMRLGVGTPCGYEHCVVWPSVQGVAMDEMVNWIMTNEFSRTTYRCTTSLQHAVATRCCTWVATRCAHRVARNMLQARRAAPLRADQQGAAHEVEPLARRNRQVRSGPESTVARRQARRQATTLNTTLSTLNECSIERLACSRLHALVRSTSESVSRMRADRIA